MQAVSSSRSRMITIEYVLIHGVNDSLDDAKRLVRLISGIPCKVNLIPFNEHDMSSSRSRSRQQ